MSFSSTIFVLMPCRQLLLASTKASLHGPQKLLYSCASDSFNLFLPKHCQAAFTVEVKSAWGTTLPIHLPFHQESALNVPDHNAKPRKPGHAAPFNFLRAAEALLLCVTSVLDDPTQQAYLLELPCHGCTAVQYNICWGISWQPTRHRQGRVSGVSVQNGPTA